MLPVLTLFVRPLMQFTLKFSTTPINNTYSNKKLNDNHQNTTYQIMIQSADWVIISYKVLFWCLSVYILFISPTQQDAKG